MDKGVLGDLKVNRVGFGAKRLLRAGFTAADREGAVRLLEVQRAGKRSMAAKEFLRGAPLRVGGKVS